MWYNVFSLRTKLILSYLAVALLTALFVYGLSRFTSAQYLRRLLLGQRMIEMQQEVADWYEAKGTWDGFREYFRTLHPPPRHDLEDPLGKPGRGLYGLVDANHRTIIPTLGYDEEIVPARFLTDAMPVVVNGQTVAWVVPDDESAIGLRREEEIYLERTNDVLLVAALLGVFISALIGALFAQRLTKPVREMTFASQAMAIGDLDQQIIVHSQDELGQLAEAFNQMSSHLARATQQRRQMTADIAHDLSTPIQIIAGYTETLLDGSLPLTKERIQIIGNEIEHLHRLVNDLDLLAQSDTRTLSLRQEEILPKELLERVTKAYKPLAASQEIELDVALSSNIPPIYVDKERMMQVIGNLLNNALRYTPAGGQIRLSAYHKAPEVQISVHDNGQGIAEADLPYLFDRFYRAEPAREGNSGKMGLGLAICKALVEAQGGKISAQSCGLNQGTTFTIHLTPSC